MTEATLADREKVFAEERAALERKQQDRRNTENARLRDARLKALADETAARAEARRAEAEASLKAQLRLAFLASPAASESDFEKAYPALRLEHLAREAVEAPQREKRALKSSGYYNGF